jgi:hypothetical protein
MGVHGLDGRECSQKALVEREGFPGLRKDWLSERTCARACGGGLKES